MLLKIVVADMSCANRLNEQIWFHAKVQHLTKMFTIIYIYFSSHPREMKFYFEIFIYRFLSVKKWLLRKKHQIELARKRGWKGYWVCLKGTTLLFYPCDSREGRQVESAPKHLIIVDGAIMQSIPEHPKRDYIFCLSTAFGDAYLFQAPCQVNII